MVSRGVDGLAGTVKIEGSSGHEGHNVAEAPTAKNGIQRPAANPATPFSERKVPDVALHKHVCAVEVGPRIVPAEVDVVIDAVGVFSALFDVPERFTIRVRGSQNEPTPDSAVECHLKSIVVGGCGGKTFRGICRTASRCPGDAENVERLAGWSRAKLSRVRDGIQVVLNGSVHSAVSYVANAQSEFSRQSPLIGEIPGLDVGIEIVKVNHVVALVDEQGRVRRNDATGRNRSR